MSSHNLLESIMAENPPSPMASPQRKDSDGPRRPQSATKKRSNASLERQNSESSTGNKCEVNRSSSLKKLLKTQSINQLPNLATLKESLAQKGLTDSGLSPTQKEDAVQKSKEAEKQTEESNIHESEEGADKPEGGEVVDDGEEDEEEEPFTPRRLARTMSWPPNEEESSQTYGSTPPLLTSDEIPSPPKTSQVVRRTSRPSLEDTPEDSYDLAPPNPPILRNSDSMIGSPPEVQKVSTHASANALLLNTGVQVRQKDTRKNKNPKYRKSSRNTLVGSMSPLESPIFRLKPLKEEYIQYRDKRWKKRWLILDDESLYIFRSHEDLNEPITIKLMGSAVKRRPDAKSDIMFDVITAGQNYSFQTETEADLMQWVIAITQVCENLVLCEIGEQPRVGSDTSREGEEEVEHSADSEGADVEHDNYSREICIIVKEEGNSECADCGAPDPQWASINLGVFVCIACSGIHRSFGTHISKVRSLKLDKWEVEHLEVMKRIGNRVANQYWEHCIPSDFERIEPGTNTEKRVQWLRWKYVEKRFTNEWEDLSKEPTPFNRTQLKSMFLSLLENDSEFREQVRLLLKEEETTE